MMSLPVWLPGPMFLPGGSLSLVPCSFGSLCPEQAARILLECILVPLFLFSELPVNTLQRDTNKIHKNHKCKLPDFKGRKQVHEDS